LHQPPAILPQVQEVAIQIPLMASEGFNLYFLYIFAATTDDAAADDGSRRQNSIILAQTKQRTRKKNVNVI
jgi:hypothetical protein